MENFFNSILNANTINALKQGAAFFMGSNGSRIPPIVDSFSGNLTIGVNFFNLKLSFDLGGKGHTECVKTNEALSSNPEWFSTLPRESRPMGTLYQEESAGKNAGYSFVMPTAELNQSIYRDNRNMDNRPPAQQYVPFQKSNASMGNFNEFVHEQFSNAINASLANCPFKNNIQPHEMEQFKTQLINEISRNPAFMTTAVNKARDEVLEYHNVPLDKNKFIEKARDETSPEFTRLNTAIGTHVNDICQNGKQSFNPEFSELSKPLIEKVEKIVAENPAPQPAVNGEISDFVKKMLGNDQTATVLADAYAGTFVDKALDMVRTGDKVTAGVTLAKALIDNKQDSNAKGSPVEQIVDFCKNTAQKMGDKESPSRLEDFVKVAKNIMGGQELKGDKSLKTHSEQSNASSFFERLNKTIRDSPKVLEQAVAQLSNSQQQDRTQSRGQAVKR